MVEKKAMKVLSVRRVSRASIPSIRPSIRGNFRIEAVATEPALSPEDDHVVSRVYQVGYLFNGQLLRPARVVVKQWTG